MKFLFLIICVHIKSVLGDEVEKVVVSNRLDSSPCVLVTSEYGCIAQKKKEYKASLVAG